MIARTAGVPTVGLTTRGSAPLARTAAPAAIAPNMMTGKVPYVNAARTSPSCGGAPTAAAPGAESTLADCMRVVTLGGGATDGWYPLRKEAANHAAIRVRPPRGAKGTMCARCEQ